MCGFALPILNLLYNKIVKYSTVKPKKNTKSKKSKKNTVLPDGVKTITHKGGVNVLIRGVFTTYNAVFILETNTVVFVFYGGSLAF